MASGGFSAACGSFSLGEGRFFRPVGNAGGNGEFCTQVAGAWLAAGIFPEKSGRRLIVFRAIRGLTSKSKK